MKSPTAACLKTTFRDISEGKLNGNHFGQMIQSAIRLGLTSKQDVATILGVQPAHVFKKADALKPAEVQDLCKKLAL